MTVVKLRGEGNVVWDFELPLSEVFADQVRARKLVPVDDASFDAVKHLLDADVDGTVDEAEPESEPQLLPEDDPKAKLADLLARAADVKIDAEKLAELGKRGTSKAQVAEAIKAKLAEGLSE
jgi:hypothetical protein